MPALHARGGRTRFPEGLAGQIRSRHRFLKDHARQPAPAQIAATLLIEPGSPVIRLETVNTADELPVSRAISWFDGERFPDLAERYLKYESITAILKSYGVEDYLRASTHISALHADPVTLQDLRLSPGAIMLPPEAINVELNGRPVD